jgi:hypothetical protein
MVATGRVVGDGDGGRAAVGAATPVTAVAFCFVHEALSRASERRSRFVALASTSSPADSTRGRLLEMDTSVPSDFVQ